MITEINKLEDKTTNLFPVLMIHRDDLDRSDPLIVKFFTPNYGITICDNIFTEQWRTTDWDIEEFVPFRGSITLRNE